MGFFGERYPVTYGASSRREAIYRALRSARGVGGTAAPGGIEDAALRCDAEVMAASDAGIERAVKNGFGHLATDRLERLERAYGIEPMGSIQDRRNAVALHEASQSRGDCPTLEAELLEISPHLGVEYIARAQQIVSYGGKWLAPRSETPDFGGQVSQRWPNYSDAYVFHVTWDVVAAGGIPALDVFVRVGRLMRGRLPAYMDFQFHQLAGGWIAGVSRAGFGAARE